MAADPTGSSWSAGGVASTLRRGLIPLIASAIVGAVVGGVLAGAESQWRSNVILGVRSSGDALLTETLAYSAASTVQSDVVISAAAKELGVTPESLKPRVAAVVESGTTLIDLTVTAATPDDAVAAGTTVANTAVAEYSARSAAIAEQVRTAGEKVLATGKLTEDVAERARQESIGAVVGSAQGQSVEGAVTITVVSPAITASRAGVSRPVGALLGAAAATLLMALALLAGLGRRRRRVRNEADLAGIHGGGRSIPVADIDRVAGAVIESGRQCVLLTDAAPGAGPGARLSTTLAAALARSGYSAGEIDIVSGSVADTAFTQMDGSRWTVGERRAQEVVARAMRPALPVTLGTQLAIIDATDAPAAVGLFDGHQDVIPVVRVPKGSRVGEVEQSLKPYVGANPVLVLVDG